MENKTNIHWFPGHMMKTKKEIDEVLRVVDLIIEVIDARIPHSSKNPLFEEFSVNKPRLYLLTKASLADPLLTRKWLEHFKQENKVALDIDAVTNYNINRIASLAAEILKDKREREAQRGLKPRAIRAIIVGVPNVGKSTLINKLVNKRVASVGAKPGITRNLQWIKINKDFDLLDTPGISWPKFNDLIESYHLALTGAIKDEIYKKDDVIQYLFTYIKKYYFYTIKDKFALREEDSSLEIISKIKVQRGYSEDSLEQFNEAMLKEFRNGRMGRISLDRI